MQQKKFDNSCYCCCRPAAIGAYAAVTQPPAGNFTTKGTPSGGTKLIAISCSCIRRNFSLSAAEQQNYV
jgi:hypothetical protein